MQWVPVVRKQCWVVQQEEEEEEVRWGDEGGKTPCNVLQDKTVSAAVPI